MRTLHRNADHRRASAWAPASFGNFFHGFDAVGLALKGLRITVSVEPSDQDAVVRLSEGRWQNVEPRSSIAFDVVERVRRQLGLQERFSLSVDGDIPLGVGLGSSAAMAVAAAKAMRSLVRENGLLPWCRVAFEAERAFGGDHWDNVHPAYYGGLTIREPVQGEACRVRRPPRMRFVVAVPSPLLPRLRREELPLGLERPRVAQSLAAVAWALSADQDAAFESLRAAIGSGPLESVRANAIPYFEEARRLAEPMGAAVFVCGGGPSIAAAVPDAGSASRVAQAWEPLVARHKARLLMLDPLPPFAQEGRHDG